MGFTTLEAMSCGLPALVYPLGGSLEIVQDTINGFWCKSIKEFTSKITFLQNNPELLKKMSKRARKSVKKYSIKNSCQQLLTDYQYEIELKQKINIKKASWWKWIIEYFSTLS